MEATLWMVAALLAVLAVVFLAGKGAFLLAGYNTASPEEKAQYNEKRLCRVAGGGFLLLAIMLAVAILWDFQLPYGLDWIVPWGFLLVIAAIIVLANTVCKVGNGRKTGEEKKKS